MAELGEPEQGQLQLLQGSIIGIKSHHWEQGSVPAVTYTFPGPSCSRCLHKSSSGMCLSPLASHPSHHTGTAAAGVQAKPSQCGHAR